MIWFEVVVIEVLLWLIDGVFKIFDVVGDDIFFGGYMLYVYYMWYVDSMS